MKFTLIAIAVILLLGMAVSIDDAKKPTPIELGLVNWNRDLEAAQAISRSSGRPILMLFQEVPG
jgi:hypothetical protein